MTQQLVAKTSISPLTGVLVALLSASLALTGCGPVSGQASKPFEIGSIVSSVGGTPHAAVKTYTIVVLNRLTRPVHVDPIEVPSSKAGRASVWSVASGGRRLLLAHSTGSRIAIDKPLSPGTNLQIKGRITIDSAGLLKPASLAAFPRDRVRFSYVEGGRTKMADLRAVE